MKKIYKILYFSIGEYANPQMLGPPMQGPTVYIWHLTMNYTKKLTILILNRVAVTLIYKQV